MGKCGSSNARTSADVLTSVPFTSKTRSPSRKPASMAAPEGTSAATHKPRSLRSRVRPRPFMSLGMRMDTNSSPAASSASTSSPRLSLKPSLTLSVRLLHLVSGPSSVVLWALHALLVAEALSKPNKSSFPSPAGRLLQVITACPSFVDAEPVMEPSPAASKPAAQADVSSSCSPTTPKECQRPSAAQPFAESFSRQGASHSANPAAAAVSSAFCAEFRLRRARPRAARSSEPAAAEATLASAAASCMANSTEPAVVRSCWKPLSKSCLMFSICTAPRWCSRQNSCTTSSTLSVVRTRISCMPL
mmetsp:Transcript_40927/g.95578  ORF Transcript_40927/g.95578 Transcript_40927/m.95578 type:complete len:304 (+) Transcript_40927:1276-2187(+)